MAEGRSTNIQVFQDMIDKAKSAGVDEKTIGKLQKELDRLSQKMEVAVTDPAEYQELLRKKVSEESDVLKDKAYQIQQKNADKAAAKAAKDADKANQQQLKLLVDKTTRSNVHLITTTRFPGNIRCRCSWKRRDRLLRWKSKIRFYRTLATLISHWLRLLLS